MHIVKALISASLVSNLTLLSASGIDLCSTVGLGYHTIGVTRCETGESVVTNATFLTGSPLVGASFLFLTSMMSFDIESGVAAAVPENYFPDDDPTKSPIVTWKSHGNLLFANWLNYYVYQLTPFNTEKIGSELDEIGIALT